MVRAHKYITFKYLYVNHPTALDEAQHDDHHELPADVEQVVDKPA